MMGPHTCMGGYDGTTHMHGGGMMGQHTCMGGV